MPINDLMAAIYSKGTRYNLLETHEQNLDSDTVIDLIEKHGKKYGLKLSEDRSSCVWQLVARHSVGIVYHELASILKSFSWYQPELALLFITYHFITTTRQNHSIVSELKLSPLSDLRDSNSPVGDLSTELVKIEKAFNQPGILNNYLHEWLLLESNNSKTIFSSTNVVREFRVFNKAVGVLEDISATREPKSFVQELIEAYEDDKKIGKNGNLTIAPFISELIVGLAKDASSFIGYNCPTGRPLIYFETSKSCTSIQHSQSLLFPELLFNLCLGRKSHLDVGNISSLPNLDNDDMVIAFPEFSNRSIEIYFEVPGFSNDVRFAKPIAYTLLRLISEMKPDSRAIVLVPDGFLFDSTKSGIATKELLIEQDILEAVISLPKNILLPYSRVRVNLLLLNKNKPAHRKHLFLFSETDVLYHILWDKEEVPEFARGIAEQICMDLEKGQLSFPDGNNNTFATAEMLKEHNYDLIPSRLYGKQLHATTNLQGETVNLFDVVSKISKRFKPENNNIPLLYISDMEASVLIPTLVLNDSMRLRYEPGKINYNIVDKDALIVSLINSNPKPTLFKYDGVPLLITNNIMALSVDSSKVDPEYLRHYLSEDYVRTQIEFRTAGTTIPRIKEEDFLSIPIKILPDQEKQRSYIEDLKRKLIKAEKARIEKLEAINKIGSAELQILAAIKHSYKQLGIESLVFVLERVIDTAIRNNEPLNWNSPIIDGSSDTLRSHLDRLNSSVTSATKIFDSIQAIIDTEKSQQNRFVYNASELFSSILRELPDAKYFKHSCTELLNIEGWLEDESLEFEHATIYVDRMQMVEVVKNLLRNALVHGFNLDHEGEKYFYVHCQRTDNATLIKIYNNGAPFPNDFSFEDFITWRRTSDGNKGSGLGGYIINKVIRNHGGSFRMVNERTAIEEDISPEVRFSFTANFHFEIVLPFKPDPDEA